MSSSASKVLYFTGPHGSACKAMSPFVEETAARFAEDVEFVRVDVSTDRRTATNYPVSGIPTLVAVRDDKILGRSVGPLALEKIDEFFAGGRAAGCCGRRPGAL